MLPQINLVFFCTKAIMNFNRFTHTIFKQQKFQQKKKYIKYFLVIIQKNKISFKTKDTYKNPETKSAKKEIFYIQLFNLGLNPPNKISRSTSNFGNLFGTVQLFRFSNPRSALHQLLNKLLRLQMYLPSSFQVFNFYHQLNVYRQQVKTEQINNVWQTQYRVNLNREQILNSIPCKSNREQIQQNF
eukprot:TRINITY_DN7381_c0_g1_i6.p1 TRINITY_DN7381_c0_g1~~TRINITY_DN7381_c0_g1_i6.p1  ORF type:complete len:186 (+),score=-3.39 TRINITY_DN7381_c0_g1_i6:207-764(+)